MFVRGGHPRIYLWFSFGEMYIGIVHQGLSYSSYNLRFLYILQILFLILSTDYLPRVARALRDLRALDER